VAVLLTLAAVLTLRQMALLAFQVGDDEARGGGAVDMEAGSQTWYASARGGRGMCASHGDCDSRGMCMRGICVCSVLWGGGHCDRVRPGR